MKKKTAFIVLCALLLIGCAGSQKEQAAASPQPDLRDLEVEIIPAAEDEVAESDSTEDVSSRETAEDTEGAIPASLPEGESGSSEESQEPENPLVTEAAATGETLAQSNALRAAKAYLNYTAFSYQGLIEQLEFEKYSNADAVYAADKCGADWNEQAVKSAKNYLDFTAFSYKGLIKQLEFDKYTTEQATYGADRCGADWKEQAVKSAKNYLDLTAFSRNSLIEQLEFDGFTNEEAVYGAKMNGY